MAKTGRHPKPRRVNPDGSDGKFHRLTREKKNRFHFILTSFGWRNIDRIAKTRVSIILHD
jgi:hypothetical protein